MCGEFDLYYGERGSHHGHHADLEQAQGACDLDYMVFFGARNLSRTGSARQRTGAHRTRQTLISTPVFFVP